MHYSSDFYNVVLPKAVNDMPHYCYTFVKLGPSNLFIDGKVDLDFNTFSAGLYYSF